MALRWNKAAGNTILVGLYLRYHITKSVFFVAYLKIKSDKDSEPRCPFIVSHFPYGLPKLPVHSDHGRVTFESNPFHSSEIARLLGNVDASPTDLFLRPLYKLPLNKEEDTVISMSVPLQPLTKVAR